MTRCHPFAVLQGVHPVSILLGAVLFVVTVLSFCHPHLATPPTPPRPHDHGPFAPPPWSDASPAWQALDATLAPEHLARRIDRAVEQLDLQPLYDTYRRTGSLAHHPKLLLKVVLFEMQSRFHSPAAWAQHARENQPVRWLARGCQPGRSRWYAFRDRVAPFLDGWHRQVLQQAQAQGQTTATAGALDGTLIAALGSRHQLCNQTRLQGRLQQLAAAVTQDEQASQAARGPAGLGLAAPGQSNSAEQAAAQAAQGSAVPTAPPTAVATPACLPAAAVATALAPPPVTLATAPPPGNATPGTTTAPVGTPPCPRPPDRPAMVAAAPSRTNPSVPSATARAAQTQVPPTPAAPARHPAWLATTPAGRQAQYQRYQAADQQLQQRRRVNAQRRRKDRLPDQRVVVCPAEPEAALGRDKLKVFRPLYTESLLLDLESSLVLAWELFPQSNDAGTLPVMLQRTQALGGHAVKVLLGDGSFASHQQVAAAEAAGTTLYAPWGKQAHATAAASVRTPERFPKESFVWQSGEQQYVCPQGQVLRYVGEGQEKQADGESLRMKRYRCAAAVCQACPERARCTTSASGRTVTRSVHEESVERLKERMATAEGKALYKLRKQTVELCFADQKEHRGLRQFTSRGPARARCQVGLSVLAHNLVAVDQYAQAQPPKRLSLNIIEL